MRETSAMRGNVPHQPHTWPLYQGARDACSRQEAKAPARPLLVGAPSVKHLTMHHCCTVPWIHGSEVQACLS